MSGTSGNQEDNRMDPSKTWMLSQNWRNASQASTPEEAAMLAGGPSVTNMTIEDPNAIAAARGQSPSQQEAPGTGGMNIGMLGAMSGNPYALAATTGAQIATNLLGTMSYAGDNGGGAFGRGAGEIGKFLTGQGDIEKLGFAISGGKLNSDEYEVGPNGQIQKKKPGTGEVKLTGYTSTGGGSTGSGYN